MGDYLGGKCARGQGERHRLEAQLTRGSEAQSEIQYRVDLLISWPVGQRDKLAGRLTS